jgi:hypothetical protein
MSELEDSFIRLLGRQPSDTERQQLYHIRDALDLKNNDALWLVLMALQYHQTLYAGFPELIRDAAAETLAQFQETADDVLSASKESAKADLARAVSAAARDVARLTALRQTTASITLCLAGCCAVIGALTLYVHGASYDAGYQRGYAGGYGEARDEKAAAAWANTPQGKAAYRFAQQGGIDNLIKCDRPGWKVEDGVCYVRATADGSIYGWRVR